MNEHHRKRQSLFLNKHSQSSVAAISDALYCIFYCCFITGLWYSTMTMKAEALGPTFQLLMECVSICSIYHTYSRPFLAVDLAQNIRNQGRGPSPTVLPAFSFT